MCITGMGLRASSTTIPLSSFFLCINIHGIPAREQRRMFDAALERMSVGFKPDLIIISAGFDSHRGDPLGQLTLEDEDFVSLTAAVKEWANSASNGRIISCLEGGYNPDILGGTVRAHVAELERS